MKKSWKKLLALLMCVGVLSTCFAATAWAEPAGAAKIGETVYATLDEAIAAAADGDTVELLDDCTTEGINLKKNLTICGSEKKETVTFTKYGVALWGKALTFKNCSVVMNAIGSTPYAEWTWMTVATSQDSSFTLDGAEMLLDGDPGKTGTPLNAHAFYFSPANKLNLINGAKLTVKNYKEDALEWDGGNGGYNVNITDSVFVSDGNRSGFTGTFTAAIKNSTVEVINSFGNGSNGANFDITDSTVNFSDNGSHGLSAGNLIVKSSEVTASGNGANGIHVTGELKIAEKSVVVIEDNDCSVSSKWTFPGALQIAGKSEISDSTVTIRGNKGSGIYQKSGTLTVAESAQLTVTDNEAEKLGFGGGIYVNGTMTLPDGVAVYNNHADTAGDDIYSLGELTLGEVGEGWMLDCEHEIDGWYDDAENDRWDAHAEDDADLHAVKFDVNGEELPAALKAAHAVIYYTVTVNYYDKTTGEKIAESFVAEGARENAAYDVAEQAEAEIDGYTYDSADGDAPTGTLDSDKTVNVYYLQEEEEIDDPSVPTDGTSSEQPETPSETPSETTDGASSEETVDDDDIPMTGGKAVLPIAVGALIASAVCAVLVLLKKRKGVAE